MTNGQQTYQDIKKMWKDKSPADISRHKKRCGRTKDQQTYQDIKRCGLLIDQQTYPDIERCGLLNVQKTYPDIKQMWNDKWPADISRHKKMWKG